VDDVFIVLVSVFRRRRGKGIPSTPKLPLKLLGNFSRIEVKGKKRKKPAVCAQSNRAFFRGSKKGKKS